MVTGVYWWVPTSGYWCLLMETGGYRSLLVGTSGYWCLLMETGGYRSLLVGTGGY